MDHNDVEPSSAFPEEDKLVETMDVDDSNWFGKNLDEDSNHTDINDGAKSSEEIIETDSQSDLVHSQTVKKDELSELTDIAMDDKKHDISNELKEMFEEKSSDAEELQENSLTKHSLHSEIKEDKLKDIVPDDILGKEDSFDELDSELHQELEAHLTYEKGEDLMSELPEDVTVSQVDEVTEPQVDNTSVAEDQNEVELQEDQEIDKSLDGLSFGGKTVLLQNIAENIGTNEIDEIMEHGMNNEEELIVKEESTDSKEMSSTIDETSVDELKDDLDSQVQSVTEGSSTTNLEGDAEEVVNQVDKSSIELNKENMMVEFAHDNSNQVLIQINTEETEVVKDETPNPDAVVMETSDGQTLVFTTEVMETSIVESEMESHVESDVVYQTEESDTSQVESEVVSQEERDMASQVEGGADFLHAVTGKLEDVLSPVKEDPQKEVAPSAPPTLPVKPVVQTPPVVAKKEPPKEGNPRCCVTTCKSGKTTLRTTYRFFKPPTNSLFYKKWEYIFNSARQQLTPDSFICEIHFRTGLIYKKGTDKSGKIIWALREGALPKLTPSGILRVSGAPVPSPSTTVQVPKKAVEVVKTPQTKPLAVAKSISSNVTVTPKPQAKKILQKPVKTVAQKVTNEVTDIGFLYKNPELVKVAQDEISSLDVLVCGECHSVFHILELFQAHKMAANCVGESNFKGNPSEPKPQVWAFLLWKSAQARVSDVESSWRLYQRWCKMDENVRNSWISAGKFLQEGNALSSMKLVDSPVPKGRVGRPPARISDDEEYITTTKPKRPKPPPPPPPVAKVAVSTEKSQELDMGGAGDAPSMPEPMETENSDKEDDPERSWEHLSRQTPEMITSEVEIKQEVLSDEDHGENKENDSDRMRNISSEEMQNCSKCKEPIVNLKGAIICAAGCYAYFHVECTRIATYRNLSKMGSKKLYWKCDSCKIISLNKPADKEQSQQVSKAPTKPKNDSEDEEFVVEKIVSRRYNIKKKHFEYLLKWEGYPPEQNTWEPAENLGTCQHLLKAFEEALAKQQAAKAARQGGGVAVVKEDKIKPPVIPGKRRDPPPPSPALTTSGRPDRRSKQKAMDQVKVWCGSIVRPTEDDTGIKRRMSSDSEYEGDDEVVVKRVKVEHESEDDSDFPSVRKIEKLVTPCKGRGRPPGTFSTPRGISNTVKPLASKPVVNGDQVEENLAVALGLESDDEDNPPQIKNMSSLSPSKQQVLVASAKGVMTVDPKQVPNLSSGVYIMSNKSGIVKVDNDNTLNTLKKSGLLKKPVSSPVKGEQQKSESDVIVLPKQEPGSPVQQKSGLVKKAPVTPAGPSTPGLVRPPGVLKPMRPGVMPRPLGLLKPTQTSSEDQGVSRSVPVSSGGNVKVVRPSTVPVQGRGGGATGIMRKPVERAVPQTPLQQKLLVPRKTELSPLKPSVTVTPSTKTDGTNLPLLKPRIGGLSPTTSPLIRSTNKPLSHPLLNRGRGRGGFRGRGRGGSFSQIMQMNVQQEPEPDPVKDSKLVDSDNLLMEFQEPSDSEESSDGLEDIFPNMDELPPIEPDSPPRPLSLCPLTGKRLCKAEGERTPEPTPPPSPKAPTPPPPPPPPTPPLKMEEEEPTHILPDDVGDELETETIPMVIEEVVPPPTTVTKKKTGGRRAAAAAAPTPTTTIVKQDGMICKVEMSPGGTTGTLIDAIRADDSSPSVVTEGTVTIKKPLASRNRPNRGPQLSVIPDNSNNTSLGTIQVPARKLFQEESGEDDMVTITGEDGMIYQVSNSELAGNTLLLSSEDGQQQCVYVTTGEEGEEGTILTLDSAYADAVAQLGTDQVNILSTENGDQYFIKEGEDGEQQLMTIEGEEGMVAADDQSGQVVAQLVEAGEPAPGGSRRVVLLLPDGNLMMTEVDEEQYAALDLDK